jgi:hypothetical protein
MKRKSDRIEVYVDPMTEENLEGVATVVRRNEVLSGFPELAEYEVRFDGDDPDDVYRRHVLELRPEAAPEGEQL